MRLMLNKKSHTKRKDNVFDGLKVQPKWYSDFDDFFTNFSNQIRSVCSTQKQSDVVFNLCETLVQE